MTDIMLRVEGRYPVHLTDCLFCSRCKDTLMPGDEYFSMGEEILCEDCMDGVLRQMRKVVGE